MSVHNNYKDMPSYKIKSSLIHRQGLYATHNIKRGMKIIEYKGKKITKHKAETDLKYDDPKLIYLFDLNKKYDLDGDFKYNTARLVNHSCDPNCEIIDNGKSKLWIYSTKSIRKNEELTYDYGFSFDKDYKKYPCNCGSGNCVGYIIRQSSRWRLKKIS